LSSEYYELLVKRAKHFLKLSDIDAEDGRYDIALFHLEQALQPALKADLLRSRGDFPRVDR